MGRGTDTAEGAMGGAATGASVGSAILPVWGTAIGAGVGGIAGGALAWRANKAAAEKKKREAQEQAFHLIGSADRGADLQNAIGQAGGVQAPNMQAAHIRQMQSGGTGGQFGRGQEQLAQQLQLQAMGQGPSLATSQYENAMGSGIAAQMAMARSGTGPQGAAMRGAAQNVGSMTQNLAGQAAQARIQEQMLARQQLAGVLQQGRGQSLQASQFDANAQNQRLMQMGQFGQQANLQNQQAWLQNQGQQNQYGLGLRELELANARGESEARMGLHQMRSQQPKEPDFATKMLSGGGMALANVFGKKGG